MPHRTGWKQLTVGILSFFGIITVGLVILVFGRIGQLHGKTFQLYVVTPEASGVIPGTEVWLDGRRVGLVKDISFMPTAGTDSQRLVIRADVLDRVRGRIRRDSRTRLQSGGSFLGAPVVYLSSGTPRAGAIRDGDTLVSQATFDVQATMADAALAVQDVPAIMANVKILTAQLSTAQGTLGALGAGGSELQPRIAAVERQMSNLSEAMQSPSGAFGRMTAGVSKLQSDAQLALAQVDSVRELLGSDQHSLGRFRRDSSLLGEMNRIHATLAAVMARADTTMGTLGRARRDMALQRSLAAGTSQLDSLLADVHKHPFRYIPF